VRNELIVREATLPRNWIVRLMRRAIWKTEYPLQGLIAEVGSPLAGGNDAYSFAGPLSKAP
jgi:hypothetical protein